jgi:hypothetical protein
MIGYFKQRLKKWCDDKITCAVLEAAASDTQQRNNSHDALILMGTSNNPFLWGVIRIRPVIWVVIWVSFQKRGC